MPLSRRLVVAFACSCAVPTWASFDADFGWISREALEPAAEGSESVGVGACHLQVWSHRGAEPTCASCGPLLSERSLHELVGHGITRFDLDLFFTTDQKVYVAHPVALRDVLSIRSSSIHSLQVDAKLLPIARLLGFVEKLNVTVALDLKGADQEPEQHASHMLWLGREVQRRRLESRVWLWADGSAVARILRRQLRRTSAISSLILLKPIRDRGLPDPADCAGRELQRGDERLFTMLGPSFRCATGALLSQPWARERWGVAGTWADELTAGTARAHASGLLVWVADEVEHLPPLLRLGVRHVISNRPLSIQSAARTLCMH